MKDIDELENMTWGKITTNEGPLTQLVLGVMMVMLSIMYLVLGLYFRIRFWR